MRAPTTTMTTAAAVLSSFCFLFRRIIFAVFFFDSFSLVLSRSYRCFSFSLEITRISAKVFSLTFSHRSSHCHGSKPLILFWFACNEKLQYGISYFFCILEGLRSALHCAMYVWSDCRKLCMHLFDGARCATLQSDRFVGQDNVIKLTTIRVVWSALIIIQETLCSY